MQPKDRYDTADLDENQFEPGSRRRVLKNLLGITSRREMDQLEGREQVRSLKTWRHSTIRITALWQPMSAVFTKSGWAESIPGRPLPASECEER